jgi:chromosome segregation ATPase
MAPADGEVFGEGELEAQLETGVALAEPVGGDDIHPPVRVERMTPKEETVMRLREGFSDLSNLLGTINTNIQDQTETSRGIRDKIDVLPALLHESKRGNESGDEFMSSMLRETSEAGLRQKEALQNLRSLPVALAAIQENEIAQYKALAAIKDELAKRAQIEREMVESFKSFDSTLSKLTDVTATQAEHIDSLGHTQKEMVSGFHKVQAKTIETFQLAQERTFDDFQQAQSTVLHTFQQTQERMKKKFIWGLGAVAAIMGFLAIVVFGLWMRAVNDLSDGNKEVQRRASAIEERATKLLEERDGEIAKLRSALDGGSAAKDDEFRKEEEPDFPGSPWGN